MAETLGNLSIRIGLSLNELASDFIAAEKSINENMARLAREQQIIKLRTEIDLAGLNPSKDAQKILEIQIKALNQQIASQKDRLKLAEAGLRDTALKTGELSTQTQRATIAFEREKLALANLEEQLRNISNQKIQINSDTLNAQFLNIQNTINSHIANMNQKNAIIKMKADFDLTGLDKAKDASKILEIQYRSLNQQIKNQKSILNATEKAFREIADKTGKFSAQTLQATANVERQKLSLKRLEDELRNVANEHQKISAQQKSINNTNNLLSSYQNFKSDIAFHINTVTTAFNGLQAASSSADAAITKSLDIIGSIPTPAGKAVATLASIPLVLKGVENSIINTAKAAVAAGDSVYVMSRGMQMSVAEAGKLTGICKVTGIEINEVNANLRRLQTQFVKAGKDGNLVTKTLDRYGASLVDANGKLKNFIDLSIELSNALKKAQEEGNGASFVSALGGKFWSGDFVTFLEDLSDNIELANSIVKNGLANPALAHGVQGNLNAMNFQVAQLSASFASALLPVANEIIPRTTQRMGELTKVIAANKDNIKFIGEVITAPIKAINSLTDGVISLSKAIDNAKDSGSALGKVFNQIANYRDDLSTLLNVAPLATSAALLSPIPGATEFAKPLLEKLYSKEIEQYKESQKKAEETEKAKLKATEERVQNSLGLSAKEFANIEDFEAAEKASLDRRIAYQKETADISYKLTHNEYENKKHELRNWFQEQMSQEHTTNEERFAIIELAATKEKQIEQEQFEKMKQVQQDFSDTCNAIHQTELEKRLAQIEKEKQAWIQKGIDEVKATELAEQQKADAQRNAAMNVLQSQLKEFRIWRDQGEQALRDYQLHQLHKSGISNYDLNSMNAQSLQNFQRAFQDNLNSFLPNMTLPNNFTNPINNNPISIDNSSFNELKEALNRSAAKLDDFKFKSPDTPSLTDSYSNEKFNDVSDSISDLSNKFDSLGSSVSNLTDILDNLPKINAADGYNGNDNLCNNPLNENPVFDSSLIDALHQMSSDVIETKDLFAQFNLSDLSNSIIQSSQQIADAKNYINSIQSDMLNASTQLNQIVSSMSQTNSALSKVESALNKVGEIKAIQPNISVTQNINQPHAWNNSLIQELADKVADKMKNEIIYALKSSYSY